MTRSRYESSLSTLDGYGLSHYGPWRGSSAESVAMAKAATLRSSLPNLQIIVNVVEYRPDGTRGHRAIPIP